MCVRLFLPIELPEEGHQALQQDPGTTYAYDNNGNLTTKTDVSGTTTHAWDFENRLVSLTPPASSAVTFSYDPFGRRTKKATGSSTTIYVYDGANIIEEVDAAGAVLARYNFHHGLVGVVAR